MPAGDTAFPPSTFPAASPCISLFFLVHMLVLRFFHFKFHLSLSLLFLISRSVRCSTPLSSNISRMTANWRTQVILTVHTLFSSLLTCLSDFIPKCLFMLFLSPYMLSLAVRIAFFFFLQSPVAPHETQWSKVSVYWYHYLIFFSALQFWNAFFHMCILQVWVFL